MAIYALLPVRRDEAVMTAFSAGPVQHGALLFGEQSLIIAEADGSKLPIGS